jgi:hypothetical protein
MAQLVVDGFATYGFGPTSVGNYSYPNTPTAVGTAMLSGVWAQIGTSSAPGGTTLPEPAISTLPWAPADTDLYLSRCTATYNSGESSYVNSSCFRRVLPVTADPVILSVYYAISYLPPQEAVIVGFADSSNTVAAWLFLTASGGLQLRDAAGTSILAQTSGPVIVAEQAYHLEMKFSPTAGTFTLNVNEVAAITATGLGVLSINPTAQLRFFPCKFEANVFRPQQYLGNLIIRDTTGTYNKAITGDRRVATLMVNADDPAHQNWINHPIKKFGAGLLDLTKGYAFLECTERVANSFKIGASDYTLEGQVRFSALPSGTAFNPIFASWQQTSSYAAGDWLFALGSQSLNNGQLFLKASPDGTYANAQTIWTYPWAPVLDTWYHIALCRSGGVVTVYVDGQQLGPVATDVMTYGYTKKEGYLGSVDPGGYTSVSAAYLWIDDIRWTLGACRYTSNFAKPTVALPIGSGSDPLWSNVALRLTFDDQTTTDYSQFVHLCVLQAQATTVAVTDGAYNFQSMDNVPPNDQVFLSADFVAAQANLSFSSIPVNGDTVTVATKDGVAAAVYTWKTTLASAYDVLIGATTTACAANLTNAINGGVGVGTTYGTGTVANYNVVAYANPGPIMNVVANVAGTVGNSLASTRTGTATAWDSAHLYGGVDIPAYSQFGYQRLPSNATLVDSVTIATRMWKTDAGTATVVNSLRGRLGGLNTGATHTVSTAPTVYLDTFEVDPDSPANPLSPAVITQAMLRINRTS